MPEINPYTKEVFSDVGFKREVQLASVNDSARSQGLIWLRTTIDIQSRIYTAEFYTMAAISHEQAKALAATICWLDAGLDEFEIAQSKSEHTRSRADRVYFHVKGVMFRYKFVN